MQDKRRLSLDELTQAADYFILQTGVMRRQGNPLQINEIGLPRFETYLAIVAEAASGLRAYPSGGLAYLASTGLYRSLRKDVLSDEAQTIILEVWSAFIETRKAVLTLGNSGKAIMVAKAYREVLSVEQEIPRFRKVLAMVRMREGKQKA